MANLRHYPWSLPRFLDASRVGCGRLVASSFRRRRRRTIVLVSTLVVVVCLALWQCFYALFQQQQQHQQQQQQQQQQLPKGVVDSSSPDGQTDTVERATPDAAANISTSKRRKVNNNNNVKINNNNTTTTTTHSSRPTLILHVGLPKTGTTFLQTSLCGNYQHTEPVLLRDRLVYLGTCPYFRRFTMASDQHEQPSKIIRPFNCCACNCWMRCTN